MSAEMIETKKSEASWTRKQRIVLDIIAVLGLVNMLVYIILQSSFVQQNFIAVYAITMVIDLIGLIAMGTVKDDWGKSHFHERLPKRFRNAFILMGSYVATIPVVLFLYFNPVIAIPVIAIAWYAWGTSLVVSGVYDISYVFTIVGIWLTEGMFQQSYIGEAKAVQKFEVDRK